MSKKKGGGSCGFVLVIALLVTMCVVASSDLNKMSENETKTLILESITEKYEVVTRTVTIREEVVTDNDANKGIERLIFGKRVKATGNVRVDVGVDMTSLTEDDIEVVTATKTVMIRLPEAEVLSVAVEGDIDVKVSRGLLTAITDREEEYNPSAELLKKRARESVIESGIMESAREDASGLLETLVGQMGYTLKVISTTTK